MASGYSTVSLPDDLIRKIDRFIERNDWGFRTRPEVIAAALREFLKSHEPQP